MCKNIKKYDLVSSVRTPFFNVSHVSTCPRVGDYEEWCLWYHGQGSCTTNNCSCNSIPKIVWRNVTFFAIFKGERILRNGLDRNFVWCFIFIERGFVRMSLVRKAELWMVLYFVAAKYFRTMRVLCFSLGILEDMSCVHS